MKKKTAKKSFNKINKPVKGKFSAPLSGAGSTFGGKKHEDEEKKGWLREEEDWKKDELEEPEKMSLAPIAQTDKEDDWKEKDSILEDDEDIKILDEDLLEEDKDNY